MGILSSLAAGIGSLVAGVFGGDDREEAARQASGQQVAGAQAGIQNLEESYAEIQDLMAPWIEAGGTALSQQMNILGFGGKRAQDETIQSILSSPYFNELVSQQESALLQNQSATGGLRGGDTQRYLATLRPTLAAQEIDRQYGRLGGIATQGYGATGQQAGYSAMTGAGISDLQNQIGAYQAGGTLGAAEARQQRLNDIGTGIGSIAGAALGYFNPSLALGEMGTPTPQPKPSLSNGRLF